MPSPIMLEHEKLLEKWISRGNEKPEPFYDWCTRTLFHYADYYDESSCQEAYEAGQQSVMRLYGMKHMTKDGDGFA